MRKKYKISKVMEKFEKEKQSKKVHSYLDYRLDKNVESFYNEGLPNLFEGQINPLRRLCQVNISKKNKVKWPNLTHGAQSASLQ